MTSPKEILFFINYLLTHIPLFSTSLDPGMEVLGVLAKGVNVQSVSFLVALSNRMNSGVLRSLNNGIFMSTLSPLRCRIFLVSAANLK